MLIPQLKCEIIAPKSFQLRKCPTPLRFPRSRGKCLKDKGGTPIPVSYGSNITKMSDIDKETQCQTFQEKWLS